MLKIDGKTFMNIQEAVQWLLDNNALPFQSSANYIANTEIGMGTIVNPSPAKVRIGSLIFFADSKVSTVVGLTENGFIVSDQYNNLVDDIAYVTNVAINASGHLITTLSDGQTIDAGLIKQVANFSIDASQHLIVTYNDGTTTDLGAIFSGNISITGDIIATGSVRQNTANFSANVVILVPGGVTVTNIYSRVEEINGVIYVVFNFAVSNNTGATVTLYSAGDIYVNVPASIGQNIYDLSGHSVSIADASECTIMTFKGHYINSLSGNISGDLNCRLMNADSPNQMRILLAISGGLAIADGETKYFTARSFLTLI